MGRILRAAASLVNGDLVFFYPASDMWLSTRATAT
jgi:hypothetical protein